MGSDDLGLDHVNAYCRSRIGGSLAADICPVKGRVLRTTRRFECGSAIFVEPPLLLVAEDASEVGFARVVQIANTNAFSHAPLWYWAALRSLTKDDLVGCTVEIPPASAEQQTRLLLLCQPDVHESSPDVAMLVEALWAAAKGRCNAVAPKLERLLAVWLLNCFEHTELPVGFSTFFLPSFLSHSCKPNCMWHYNGDDFVLRAREDIEARDEVTVSYLSEEALLGSTASRRRQLQITKHFLCNCERCSVSLDPVRGLACPGCRGGEVLLDFSNTMPTVAKADPEGYCKSCGFSPNLAQASEMCKQELKVEELIQDWDQKAMRACPDTYLTDVIASRLQTNLQGLLSARHWLQDRANRHLIAYYESTGRADLALPLAKHSVRFTVETYPGYSALHAWALETQGDLMLRLEGFILPGPTAVEPPPGTPVEVLRKALREVAPLYTEATQILSTLFGRDHDFNVSMRDKRDALMRATQTASLCEF
jgi:hypothetical protein